MSEDYYVWLGTLKHQLNTISEENWDCDSIRHSLETLQVIMKFEKEKGGKHD